MPRPAFTLPDVTCPFPSTFADRPHPQSEEVEREVLELLRDSGMPDTLRGTLAGIRLGEFTGRLHPAASRPGLRLIMLNNALSCLHEDWIAEQDEGGRLRSAAAMTAAYRRALAVFDGSRPGPHDLPLARATGLVAQALHDLGRPQHTRRYRTTLREYWHAHLWEVDLQRQHAIPSLAEYRQLRPHVLGIRALSELLPLAGGTPVPAHLLDHPVVQALARLIVNHHVLVNDLFSLAKELHGERPVNIVLVLCAEQGLTLQEGVDATARAIEGELAAYLRLRAALPRLGLQHPALLRHLTDLERLAADAIAWHAAAPRYRVPPAAPCVAPSGGAER
ncbi:terpene synthase family protein [Kitasatospora sp. NPDC093806]|uniref:terpene synthase family protein n=1 Tax=Kitasatospora sp. NPDC093806 TaxID=3155075 RepID=UPI0034371567